MVWSLFDGAVDALVLDVFIDVAPIARNSGLWCPANDIAAEWIRRISEDVHERMSDAFGWGPDGVMVWTYVVSFARKELAIFGVLGVMTTFGLKAKEAHASIIIQCG